MYQYEMLESSYLVTVVPFDPILVDESGKSLITDPTRVTEMMQLPQNIIVRHVLHLN